MSFPILKDGEWIEPILKGFKLACCDCGLVHKIDFEIKDGTFKFRVFRQKRRWHKKRK